jgi:metal-responsive CopG/Arc/MetJ family transcriptional regulator
VGHGAEKVAISLDPELLARAERLRKQTGESRSALVGRALRKLLLAEERDRRVAEYVEAYRKVPETSREVARVRKLARRSLAAVPWDHE